MCHEKVNYQTCYKLVRREAKAKEGRKFSRPTESIQFPNPALIVDEATGYIWQYCLTNKDDTSTLTMLKKVEDSLAISNHSKPDRRIYLMSDNGEFASKEVRAACSKAGIIQMFTPPYKSKINGVVETRIRMVKQMSKTLLYGANISVPYWEYSDKYSSLIINVIPSCKEAKRGNNPYTKWNGKTFNYKRLRIWGCEAIVHIPHLIKKQVTNRNQRYLYWHDWNRIRCIYA